MLPIRRYLLYDGNKIRITFAGRIGKSPVIVKFSAE